MTTPTVDEPRRTIESVATLDPRERIDVPGEYTRVGASKGGAGDESVDATDFFTTGSKPPLDVDRTPCRVAVEWLYHHRIGDPFVSLLLGAATEPDTEFVVGEHRERDRRRSVGQFIEFRSGVRVPVDDVDEKRRIKQHRGGSVLLTAVFGRAPSSEFAAGLLDAFVELLTKLV